MSVNTFVNNIFLQHILFSVLLFKNIVQKIVWPTSSFYHIALSDMLFKCSMSRSFD